MAARALVLDSDEDLHRELVVALLASLALPEIALEGKQNQRNEEIRVKSSEVEGGNEVG